MPTFKLPKGYSFTDPHQSITVPDKGYGGADISQAFDATGVHYVACNAWGPGEPSFRFRVFKAVSPSKYVEVTGMPFLATGRGEQDIQWYDGKAWAVAWTNEQFNFGLVPGFAPFPSIPSLEARIAALEAKIATMSAQPINLTGVYQGEPNSIEVGEGAKPHAFVDVKADSTMDFGMRMINYADGHSELGHVGSGPLLIVVNGVVRLRLD